MTCLNNEGDADDGAGPKGAAFSSTVGPARRANARWIGVIYKRVRKASTVTWIMGEIVFLTCG
jgi:hypothetical protein